MCNSDLCARKHLEGLSLRLPNLCRDVYRRFDKALQSSDRRCLQIRIQLHRHRGRYALTNTEYYKIPLAGIGPNPEISITRRIGSELSVLTVAIHGQDQVF